MKRLELCTVVFAVLASAILFGCGEKAVEPGSHAAGADMAGMPGDGDGALLGSVRDELNLNGTLLVATRGGLYATNTKGESFLLNPFGSSTAGVEVCGTRIFVQTFGDIHEIDHLGNMISTIDVPDWIEYPISFAALPDGGFAVFDCRVDSVYFIDPAGAFLAAVDMPDEDAPGHLQIMSGIVRDGRLIISETGTDKIAEIDLATYTAGVLKSFEHSAGPGYLGDIDHLGRYYYITRPNRLQRFTDTGDLETVAEFTGEYNATGFAIQRHNAYVALNFAGKLYQVNLSSGKTKLVLEGLDYPRDVEFIPVILEPPPAGP